MRINQGLGEGSQANIKLGEENVYGDQFAIKYAVRINNEPAYCIILE